MALKRHSTRTIDYNIYIMIYTHIDKEATICCSMKTILKKN